MASTIRFYLRAHLRHAVGQLIRLDGQWYSLPLERARPTEPFKRLFSDRVETAEFEERLFGGRIGWSPRVNKPRKVRGHDASA